MLGVLCVASHRATAQELVGTVLPGLTPEGSTVVVCSRLADVPKDLPIPAEATAFACSLRLYGPSGDPRLRVLLVEPRDGKRPFVFVDVDRDGLLAGSERFSFSRAHEPSIRAKVRVAMAARPGSAFDRFPIDLALPSERVPRPASPDERYLLRSHTFLVSSEIRIDGRRWYFRHSIPIDASHVDLKYGYQALDTGRRVPFDPFSPFIGWGRGEPPVFRLGERYVSTSMLDLEQRRIVVQTRNADDYRRLELRPGLSVPDFGFVDIDGRSRRLSEFKGQFVLLNFWYQGCSPCSDEFPFLKEALRRFGPHGLTIVGLSESGQPESLRAMVGSSDAAWVEADPPSVRRIIQDWFQITSTPLQILLDTDGRILQLGTVKNGRSKLRGAELVKTLGRMLP